MDLEKERNAALLAAKRAGKALLRYYGKKSAVKSKPNKSLVSIADLEADKEIVQVIKKSFPNHSILSEESGFEDNKSDYKWVIDPLDGTHNFLRQIPFFGTSIALEHKGEVVLGVLHFPILKMTAIAERGKGAFLNGKRIFVSGKKSLDHAFVLFEYSYASREDGGQFLKKLIGKVIDIRMYGCAVYNLLLVACGRVDGFVILSTNEWDIASGFLIVKEAGGKITNLRGEKWGFKDKKYIVSNGKLHNELLKFFRK